MGSLSSDNHALVYGASGITGWAITNAILNGYPKPETFASVTALTNRPLSAEAALWPQSEKLQVVSGIDILTVKGLAGLEAEIKEKVKNAAKITHVYFFAYIMDPDPSKEISINLDLLSRAVSAVENISSNLKCVVLPTGTKAYGIHVLDKYPFDFTMPLKESHPRIPEPYASQMFYYAQTDMLTAMSKGKSWAWCEIIPDNIIGFVPNNNIYCMAQALGLYLSLYASINGKGAEVIFPGTEKSWKILTNETSQDVAAHVAIVASLRTEKSSGQRYNAADSAQPSTWSQKWPVICEYFGLKGVGPRPGVQGPDPTGYVSEHYEEWKALESKHGLAAGRVKNDRSFGGFPMFIMSMMDKDRPLDMTKCHDLLGEYTEEIDTKESWYTAFDRFRTAKIIP